MFFERNYRSVVALSVFILLCGCSKKEEIRPSDNEVIKLPTVKVKAQTLDRVDQLPGEIKAYQDVQIYPKVPGFIDWIGVDRGSKVKKGEVMVRLIAPELMAQKNEAKSKAAASKGQLSEAKSRLASAKASLLEAKAQLAGDTDTYQRTKDASSVPGVVAPNDVVVLKDKVEADQQKVMAWEENVKAAMAGVEAQEESLQASIKASENYRDISDYLTVTAPFDGFVTERNLHVGSFVGPRGEGAYPAIITVQELDLLRIVTPVPEIDASGVIQGAKVQFTVSTHPGERFTGTVARLGNYLERKTRTMPVELNYWNKDWRILPGMFCEVYWPTRRHNETLFVPSSAVETTSTLETFVNLVNDKNEIEWVPVKRGEMMGNMIEVFGKLKAGATVALKGDDALKAGTKVEPVRAATF
jgi:membrane fusion protein (multidrug efflux system)